MPPPTSTSSISAKDKGKGREVPDHSKKRHGEGEIVLNQERLEAALAAERKRKTDEAEDKDQMGGPGWSMAGKKKPKYVFQAPLFFARLPLLVFLRRSAIKNV
jgi:hypothetical protein